ncbi:MAG: preprotein translocase subunit SecA [Phycisphaeraceae bacterium]|nr:preprotein translocase subunit SecA [Phycisphaeraceae bacterium]
MVISAFGKTYTRIFGSRNDRLLKTYRRRVEQINALEREVAQLTDAQLREKTTEFTQRLAAGESREAIVPAALAVAREAMDRAVGIRNIFKPELAFDPATLPESQRGVHAQVKAQIAATAPKTIPGQNEPVPGWMQVEIPNSLYQAVRALYPESRPPYRARPFDVQLIGGMVLWEGKISEMKTGEGKTIVAPLACYLSILEGLQCHIVTVNDYLVQRDRDWVFPFYYHLGLTVGAIHPFHMQPPEEKKQAYFCNALYGTNSEFGFDYLRDNMKLTLEEQVQKHRDFCIIDEVDSILIDEARTPLIISGPAHEDTPRYALADQIARHLMQKQRDWDAQDAAVQQAIRRIKGLEGDIRNARDKNASAEMKEEMGRLAQQLPELESQRDRNTRYYEVEMDKKASHLTHDGVAEAQKVANIGSFYVGTNMDFPHLLENALRAHAVYQRDKDYVVQNGEVIIVDEFTGRLMIGRQWSDGLHQAVEAKEKVKVKQETQTLATVTIQNFAKLYKRLAGMTGTAMTESQEFHEIYKLEVVSIPTNRPVTRVDRDDLIYLSQKDKWSAILDEIKRYHDLGRPVLVGTTSVEKSEMLSGMLAKRHGIKHEVLNAKQHEREALIVAHAGELGAVMIATNMAGRGTDIKLAAIERAALVHHWQQRNLLPRQAAATMSDEELVSLSYRHQASVVLGWKPKDVEAQSDQEIHLQLLRHWVGTFAMIDPAKAGRMSAEACMSALDALPDFMFHRLKIYQHVEQMGGLHIVGTERHEARRIDNQLRGRSGRQGDRGSSRFFISLDDELMALFAGKTTLTALSKLGMKEGDSIEHRWVTKSVERAQKKVEERNFEIRKNLLEYDEVMEHQRSSFYGIRQAVLAGRDVHAIVFGYLTDAVESALSAYLADDYLVTQIAEWCRQTLDVSVDPSKLRTDSLSELERQVRQEARGEARSIIELTIGEYMSSDLPAEEWDYKGLSSWAMSRFSVDLTQSRLRQMSIQEVRDTLAEAAVKQIDKKDLSGLAKFLEPHYAQRQIVDWARTKFGIELSAQELAKLSLDDAIEHVLEKARLAYRRREVTYPVEFALDMTFMIAQQDRERAAAQLAGWANHRYEMGWTAQDVLGMAGKDLHGKLVAEADHWINGDRLQTLVDRALAEHPDAQALAEWAGKRLLQPTTAQELVEAQDRRELLLQKGRSMLRAEMTELERFVLLQILDTAWKDHLYAMDQVRDSVSLRGYAEKDPRIEYKREGANQFEQMQQMVRERVTDLIFRARLTPNVQVRSVYNEQEARHEEAQGVVSQQAAAAASQGTSEQQEDIEAAERAGTGGGTHFVSRKQRRAAEAKAAKKAREHPVQPRHKRR